MSPELEEGILVRAINGFAPDSAVLLSIDCFNENGPDKADRSAYKIALQNFSHIALSSLQPGGGKLCQEVPRLVLIITAIVGFFNVNLRGIFARGMTA